MDHPPNPAFLDDITAALDWWRDAGVDCDFLDEPAEWLTPLEAEGGAPPERRRPEPKPDPDLPPPPPRLDPAALPADLLAFNAWWLAEPLLCEGGPAARVTPQGPRHAELMIVVEQPEEEDGEILLSGPDGKLLDAILSAFGLARKDVYLASALPRATPGADWAAMTKRGIGQVLRHHVNLVAPRRLMILGGNVLPLIDHESPQRPAMLTQFKHEGGSIPLLACWALSALRAQPRAKPVLWRAWLEWTDA